MSTIWSNVFHLADDARMLGPLCNISVFPFKNAKEHCKPRSDVREVSTGRGKVQSEHFMLSTIKRTLSTEIGCARNFKWKVQS